MTTGALGVSWVKYYCRYHKEGRQLFMVPCEQKTTTKQVKKSAATSWNVCLFYFPPLPPYFLKCHFLLSAGSTVTAAVFPPAGPRAAHAQVLHPAEVGLHRQALLLWRGDEREVSAGQRRGTGQQQSLAGLRGEQVVVGGGSKGTVSPNNFPEQQVALLSCRGPPPKKLLLHSITKLENWFEWWQIGFEDLKAAWIIHLLLQSLWILKS